MAYWDRFAKKKANAHVRKAKKRLLNYISKGKALTTKLYVTETGITELCTFKLFGFGSAPKPFFTWCIPKLRLKLRLNYTSSYVEDGGEAKSVAASCLVTQPISANVKHLSKEKT